jgi:hypothetical protein
MHNTALLTSLGSVVLSFAEEIVEGNKIGQQIPVVESSVPMVAWAWESCVIIGFYACADVYLFVFPPTGGEGIGGRLDHKQLRKLGFDLTPQEIRRPAELVY